MMNRVFLLLFFILLACSCGRYGNPIPPEGLSTRAASEYQITPLIEGVQIDWKASLEDVRGKQQKFFDGFNIYRIKSPTRERIEDFKFSKKSIVSFVPDQHFEKFEEAIEEAKKKGLPTRKVTVAEEDLLYTFTDRDEALEVGSEYGYFIVPIHYGDVRGEVTDCIVFSYKGLESTSYVYSLIDDQPGIDDVEVDPNITIEADQGSVTTR